MDYYVEKISLNLYPSKGTDTRSVPPLVTVKNATTGEISLTDLITTTQDMFSILEPSTKNISPFRGYGGEQSGDFGMKKLVVSTTGEHIFTNTENNRIIYSSDYGVNWNTLNSSAGSLDVDANFLPSTYGDLGASMTKDGSTLIVGTATDGLYALSTDYGATWTSGIDPHPSSYLGVRHISGDGSTAYASLSTSAIYKSTNFGVDDSFALLHTASEAFKVDSIKSSNDGSVIGFLGNITVSPPTVENDNYIHISSDSGSSFNTYNPKNPNYTSPIYEYYSIDISENGTYVVVLAYNVTAGSFEVFKSSNSGSTWSLVQHGIYHAAIDGQDPLAPNKSSILNDVSSCCIAVDNSGDYLYANKAVGVSANGAYIIKNLKRVGMVYAEVWRSADSGTTFTNNSFNTPNIYTVDSGASPYNLNISLGILDYFRNDLWVAQGYQKVFSVDRFIIDYDDDFLKAICDQFHYSVFTRLPMATYYDSFNLYLLEIFVDGEDYPHYVPLFYGGNNPDHTLKYTPYLYF